jgi:hypothetical protein
MNYPNSVVELVAEKVAQGQSEGVVAAKVDVCHKALPSSPNSNP